MAKLDRLSVDVSPMIHKKIKAMAALCGKTIRQYVIESVKEKMDHDEELKILNAMTLKPNLIFEEIWNNEEDSVYDNL